jgi:hypothetical protein
MRSPADRLNQLVPSARLGFATRIELFSVPLTYCILKRKAISIQIEPAACPWPESFMTDISKASRWVAALRRVAKVYSTPALLLSSHS